MTPVIFDYVGPSPFFRACVVWQMLQLVGAFVSFRSFCFFSFGFVSFRLVSFPGSVWFVSISSVPSRSFRFVRLVSFSLRFVSFPSPRFG